jgi:hypothetical protein
MAEERRKGAPDRRRTRGIKPTETGDQTIAGDPPNPNDTPALDAAERLDESIRSRQEEERGEVF